jgi:acylphosphatase
VGFRWYVRKAAERATLAGWVRNLPDGDVEIAAAGDPSALEAFLHTVRRGPPGATIEHVEWHTVDDADSLSFPFTIVR